MRTAPLLLCAVVAVGAAACTTEEVPTSISTPTGPCAAERVEPPDGTEEQRLHADLDGDGSKDEVVSWLRDGERVGQAWLANGQNAAAEPLAVSELLVAADVDGDSRAEVFAAVPAEGAAPQLRGGVFTLDGCRLVRVEDPAGPLEYVYGSGADRLQAAATVRCPGNGVLEQVTSTQSPAPGFRLVETTRWVLTGGKAAAPITTSARVPAAQDPARQTEGEVACG